MTWICVCLGPPRRRCILLWLRNVIWHLGRPRKRSLRYGCQFSRHFVLLLHARVVCKILLFLICSLGFCSKFSSAMPMPQLFPHYFNWCWWGLTGRIWLNHQRFNFRYLFSTFSVRARRTRIGFSTITAVLDLSYTNWCSHWRRQLTRKNVKVATGADLVLRKNPVPRHSFPRSHYHWSTTTTHTLHSNCATD